jgi:hypothetical protein
VSSSCLPNCASLLQVSRGLAPMGFSGERSTVSPASPEVSSTATGGLRHFPAGVVAESATSPESVGSVGVLDGQELHLDLNGLHGTREVGDNAVEAWLHKRDAAAGAQVQPHQMLHLSQPFTANLETSRVRHVMDMVGLRCPASSHNLQLCVCKLSSWETQWAEIQYTYAWCPPHAQCGIGSHDKTLLAPVSV